MRESFSAVIMKILLLFLLKSQQAYSSSTCLGNLELCEKDEECCNNYFCDKSLPSLGTRCRLDKKKVEKKNVNKKRKEEPKKEILDTTSSKPFCLKLLDICSNDDQCCQDMKCDTSLGSSLGNRCRYPVDTSVLTKTSAASGKDVTAEEEFETTEFSTKKSSTSFEENERKSFETKEKPKCQNHLDICETDEDCCKSLQCDKSLAASLGNRCRFLDSDQDSSTFTRNRRWLQSCKNNLDACEEDYECCDDLICDDTLKALGSRCRIGNRPKKQGSPPPPPPPPPPSQSESKPQESFSSSSSNNNGNCQDHLQKCTINDECCGDLLCDASVESLGSRCRYLKNGATGVTHAPPPEKIDDNSSTSFSSSESSGSSSSSSSSSGSSSCVTAYSSCESDGDCCNPLSCINISGTSTVKRCLDVGKGGNQQNEQQKQQEPPPPTCLNWRDDCTNDLNACCEGLTCSSFNHKNGNSETKQCHFVAYDVKIKD